MKPRIRTIAFYLPQFHPIPENDTWWGKGFTEWTNVAKARPLFRGHYQPRVPADLGFYDLRLAEARAAQATLAQDYGIEGFCYWHYWFAGRRILERPFQEVLETGEPSLPFCLAWANETWTGIWHGLDKEILIEQTYPGKADHREHFEFLARAFADRRYIRVGGKPLFIIYKPLSIPNLLETLNAWRAWAQEFGLEGLHVLGVTADPSWDPRDLGLDGAIFSNSAPTFWYSWRQPMLKLLRKARRSARLQGLLPEFLRGPVHVYKYGEVSPRFVSKLPVKWDRFPVAVPNWDNSPRSGNRGYILHDSTPDLFAAHLREAVDQVKDNDADKRIVFIRAWNEWAEGNHLEPDLRWGLAYLKAVKREVLE